MRELELVCELERTKGWLLSYRILAILQCVVSLALAYKLNNL